MVRDLKAAKKPYSAPSFQVLDAGAAQAELEANGALNDANARQMLSVLNQPRDGKPSPAPSGLRNCRKARLMLSRAWPRVYGPESMRREHIIWNPATQEWFCTKCGGTSGQAIEEDAHFDLEQRQCLVPWVEMPKPASSPPGE